MTEELCVEKLREEVNPVYNTAYSCLKILSALGDKEANELSETLGLASSGDENRANGESAKSQNPQNDNIGATVFSGLIETRFFATNNFINKSGARQVVDLPCGYTPRGIKYANSGIRFFGLDLPAVSDVMAPAVKKVVGDNVRISYHGVDATNYASLRKALEGAEGELFITTEGLLMYFTQSELETVFGNIRKLLSEFGGKWITIDNQLGDMKKTPGDGASQAREVGSKDFGNKAKTELFNNIFFDRDVDKVKKFVSDMGFDLEEIPIGSFMPESIGSCANLPEERRKKVVDGYKLINFWVMTVKQGIVEQYSCCEDNFNADIRMIDKVLNISLNGRLDTISSPGLLAVYKEAAAKNEISGICIDMKNLEYISSAGLRVLLIMRKALDSGEDFILTGVNEPVKEILETTGFDSILL